MSGKPAARVTDPTACPLPGHGTNPITDGSPDVLFDNLKAARQGDASACGGAMSGNVIPNVLINGKPAVTVGTVGTVGSHGNVVIGGSGTVIIGNSHTPAPFIAPVPLPGQGFDERFVLLSPEGRPLANRRYLLVREDGRQETGVTDDQGLTHILAQHNQAENVDIYLATED